MSIALVMAGRGGGNGECRCGRNDVFLWTGV
jgi:hypothetical protein